MKKMGWQENTPLGRSGEGLVTPIKINQHIATLGVGKQEEDDFYSTNAAQHRPLLLAEKELDDEQQKRNEAKITKEKMIREEIKEITKEFYCQLCNKQYSKALEYETHLSSYDHNHKKRFMEMKQQDKLRNQSKQHKKEQQRAQKEMQKVMEQASRFGQRNVAAPPPPTLGAPTIAPMSANMNFNPPPTTAAAPSPAPNAPPSTAPIKFSLTLSGQKRKL